jgi:ribosomal protein S18 acetylase RimI-like enzyme
MAALGWLDEGTRLGLATAVSAGADRTLAYLAVDDSTTAPVGVLAVDLPPWRGRILPWLWVVEVSPQARGRGVGTELLDAAHRLLADRGYRAVELSVDSTNRRAMGLYLRLGYVPVGGGTHPGPEGPEPWTRMRLSLPTSAAQTRKNR